MTWHEGWSDGKVIIGRTPVLRYSSFGLAKPQQGLGRRSGLDGIRLHWIIARTRLVAREKCKQLNCLA